MSLEYVKYFNLFGGEVAQVPSILGNGKPEDQVDNIMVSAAEPGCFYMDITTGDLYKSIWENNEIKWKIVGSGSAEGAVRYDQLQDLEETEQERARRNIGAAAQMPVLNLSEYLSNLGYTESLIVGEDLAFDYNVGDFNDIMYLAENGPVRIILNAQYNGTTFTASFVVVMGTMRSNNSDEFMSSESICGLATTNGFHMLFYMYTEGLICHLGIVPLVVSTDLQSALGNISDLLTELHGYAETLKDGESV